MALPTHRWYVVAATDEIGHDRIDIVVGQPCAYARVHDLAIEMKAAVFDGRL